MSPRPRAGVSGVVFTAAGVLRGVARLSPLIPFVIPFGLAFGAAAVARGFSPEQAVAMSALVFAGASQFAALEVWGHPLPWVAVILTGLAVNARFFVMSAALARWANRLPRGRRTLALATLADASFADAYPALKGGERDLGVLLGGGLAQYAPWVAGTAAGAILGAAAGDLAVFGVDVVMLSFFAALAAAGARAAQNRAPAAVGAAAAVGAMALVGPGWAVILGALAGGAAGALAPERAG